MKKYIVTITYQFSAGRESVSTIPVKAKDEYNAVEEAIKKLTDKVGKNWSMANKTVFEDEE